MPHGKRLTTPIPQAMVRCNKCRSCGAAIRRQAAMRRAGGARSQELRKNIG